MGADKYIIKGPFTFHCDVVPEDILMQLSSEVFLVRASDKCIIDVYMIIKRYLIPFIVAVDEAENVVFVVLSDGYRDITEIEMFLEGLDKGKITCEIERKNLKLDKLDCLMGYRVAKSKYQIEILSLQGEILVDEHKNVHKSNEDVIRLD